MEPLVLWAGHFVVGLAYYLRFFLMKTKKEMVKEIDKAYETMSHSQVEMGKQMMENKWFILVLYLFVGYINLFIHAKKVLTKKK